MTRKRKLREDSVYSKVNPTSVLNDETPQDSLQSVVSSLNLNEYSAEDQQEVLPSSNLTDGTIKYDQNFHEERVDDPQAVTEPLPPNVNQIEKDCSTKIKRITYEARLKQISLKCEWNMCSHVCAKMEEFVKHLREHLFAELESPTEDGYLCFWQECGFVCHSKDEFNRHVYFHGFHTKIKSFGFVFMQEYSMECHLDSQGRNMIPEIPEPFECMWDDCTLQFISAQDYYWHVQGHILCVDPNKLKLYVCSWKDCTMTSLKLLRLKEHCRSHTQEKMVGCPTCGSIFTNNTKFSDHCKRQIPLHLHHHQCSHCSKRFPTERLLRDHVRHHINVLKCTMCDMTCPSNSSLLNHMNFRHSNSRPHKCPECNKGFKTLVDVNRHMTSHSEEPEFSCSFPDCTFICRSQSAYNRHLKMLHAGHPKDPYVCHNCNKQFSLGSTLTRHLIKVHDFHWPSGHSRFRYKLDEDGYFRLQTVRYESIELNQDEESQENCEQIYDGDDYHGGEAKPGIERGLSTYGDSRPGSERGSSTHGDYKPGSQRGSSTCNDFKPGRDLETSSWPLFSPCSTTLANLSPADNTNSPYPPTSVGDEQLEPANLYDGYDILTSKGGMSESLHENKRLRSKVRENANILLPSEF